MRIKIWILLLFVTPLIPYNVDAAPGYTIAPLVIDLDVVPRDIITKNIQITNTGTQPVSIFPMVNNIDVDDGGTITEFVSRVESDATASLAAWIEVKRRGQLLPKGETITIPVTFRIHPNIQPGVYHAFIGFGYGRTSEDARKMVDEGRAPGTVVTVSYNKKSREILKLGQFVVDRFITSSDNTGVQYTITNPGDEPLVPSGEIIFYNNRGVEVASTFVNPERDLIASGESREYSTAAPVEGLLGKYKAYLSIEFGTSQIASVQDTVYFYAFPFKMLMIFFGIVLLGVTFTALMVHRRYLDENGEEGDTVHLPVHVYNSTSAPQDHDIDLKKK